MDSIYHLSIFRHPETEQEINQDAEHFQHCRRLSNDLSQSIFSHFEVSTIRVPTDYFTIPDLYVIGVVKYGLFCCLASFTYHYVCEMHPDFSLGHSFSPNILVKK